VNVGIALDLRPAEQIGRDPASQLEARCIEPARRSGPEIDRLGACLTSAMNESVADATKTGVPRLDCGERTSRTTSCTERRKP
jgi:hypothetical protein